MAFFARSKSPQAPAQPERNKTLPNPPALNADGRRSLEDHRDYVLSLVRPLRPFGIGILDALGQSLCENIVSDIDLPTFTSALVDGYAVRGSDLVWASESRPVRLPVVDVLESIDYRGAPLTPGTAVRIAVGAPVPEGADAVIGLEHTDSGIDVVTITSEVAFHANLRMAGSDIADGTHLLSTGDILSPGAIGLLAEIGIDKVLVRPRPRVVVVTSGSHLVQPGLPLTSRAQSYDTTTTLIAAAARADGAQVYPLNTLEPNKAKLTQVLSDQLIRADLVVAIGDLDGPEGVAEVLGALGRADVSEVAIRPGGRQGFALIGDDETPVVALPLGAVSAFVGYHAFVRPLLRKLAGLD
ncbi:MAG: gephyrin-like molybdotransferase Glp, partial [Micropruina sp.]